MRRDRSSRSVTNAVVRNSVKRDALSSHSRDRNSNSNSHAVSKSKPSVGPVHLKRNEPRNRCDNNSHEASVSQHPRDPRHRKRRSNNSLSRSAVILERAKARSHKTEPRIIRIRSGFKSGFKIRVIRG